MNEYDEYGDWETSAPKKLVSIDQAYITSVTCPSDVADIEQIKQIIIAALTNLEESGGVLLP